MFGPDDQDSDASLNSTQVGSDVETLVDVFSTSILESFAVLGRGVKIGALKANANRSGTRPGINAPVLPDEVLGNTYVFDLDEGRYIADEERQGAPSDGVRFILYAINPLTGEPLTNVEIGHADLTDEGAADPTGAALRLQAVSGSTVWIDYAVALDGTENSSMMSIGGFLRGQSELMEFSIDVTETMDSAAHEFTLDSRFAVDGSFAVELESKGTQIEAGHWAQSGLRVWSGDDRIEFMVQEDSKDIDAQVKINGEAFATIVGPHENPDVRGAEGRILTPEEAQVLGEILEIPEEVQSTLENLQQPVALLFALAAGV